MLNIVEFTCNKETIKKTFLNQIPRTGEGVLIDDTGYLVDAVLWVFSTATPEVHVLLKIYSGK